MTHIQTKLKTKQPQLNEHNQTAHTKEQPIPIHQPTKSQQQDTLQVFKLLQLQPLFT